LTIRTGVIGIGKWGINHARVYSELEGVELVGLADRNPAVSTLAERFGTAYFPDYQDLLDEIDAVSVVVPTDLHYKVTRDCLEAGKHVLVEKPFTPDVDKGIELLKLARKNSLLLAVGYLFRFNAAVLALKDELKEIGDIQYITGRYIHSSKPPRKDSGVILNFGTHLIDILSFLVGRLPSTISCTKKHHISPIREDLAFITLDYNDFVACLEMSWLHPLKRRDLWIIGSNSKIKADLFEQMITRYPIQVMADKVVANPFVNVEINKNEPLKEELRHFLSTVGGQISRESSRLSIKTVVEAIITTRICELCQLSASSKKAVHLSIPHELDEFYP